MSAAENKPETRFIEPLDVLFLRGNKLFGDPGSYGESLVPPWPSVAAGALRSRMLADDKEVDLAAFAHGEHVHPTLGTPAAPGSFAVTAFHLARRFADGRVEALIALPADLVVSESDDGVPSVSALTPTPLPLASSASLPLLPVLAETTRGKPASGYWLTANGWKKYLAGDTPQAADLVKSDALWKLDHRVGVGLDAATRRAADGRLFSVQAVAMTKREHAKQNGFDVGFVASVSGAALPQDGTLRLGGDGRAAAVHITNACLPEPDYAAIAQAKCCRLVLATPGLFERGWLPAGITQTTDGSHRFEFAGVRARLVCAAVPRFDTVSGWDLAKWQPKPAQRAAPAGSVYWLDELDATPDALRKLAEQGLWDKSCEDSPSPQPSPQRGEGDWGGRRAEGFNRFWLADWK
jgi:CRISPR-associated protein Cmr3